MRILQALTGYSASGEGGRKASSGPRRLVSFSVWASGEYLFDLDTQATVRTASTIEAKLIEAPDRATPFVLALLRFHDLIQMHFRLRDDALGRDDLVLEGVERRFGGCEREILAVERHLHHAPAGEVDRIVLEGEFVDVGGLARHGGRVFSEADALARLSGAEGADCFAVDFQRIIAAGEPGHAQALLIERGEKIGRVDGERDNVVFPIDGHGQGAVP